VARTFCLNKNFSRHKGQFIVQIIIAVLFMFAVLLGLMLGRSAQLDVLSAIGATSLASSTFTVIALPRSPVSAPYRVFGGYALAAFVGVGWHFLARWGAGNIHLDPVVLRCIAAAAAVGTAVLLMAILDCEHPPAIGLSVGLVLEFWDDWTLLVILIAVILLCVIKLLFGRWFVNLV
jgi:CBS-domain-containing membrane protein